MALARTVYFVAPSGKQPVAEFLVGLGDADQAVILEAIELFALEFPMVVSVNVKLLRGKVWEMKVRRFRVLYGVASDSLLILTVFMKKTQKTPPREIELAETRFKKMTEET